MTRKKARDNRDAARAAGEQTYQGRPCKREGHTERYVSSGHCVRCVCKQAVAWQLANPERHQVADHTWRRGNTALAAAILGKSRVLCIYGPERIPENFDFEATIPFYAERIRLSEETGEQHEVDHIEPLMLGGLHEAPNLQVLTRTENLAKHQRDRQLVL